MAQLVDLEVDEVSLVDRPATGRRFRLFKRGAPPVDDRQEGADTLGGEISATAPEETPSLEAVWKRLDASLSSVEAVTKALDHLTRRMNDATGRLDALAEAVSASHEAESAPVAARQSLDPSPRGAVSLWKGVF